MAVPWIIWLDLGPAVWPLDVLVMVASPVVRDIVRRPAISRLWAVSVKHDARCGAGSVGVGGFRSWLRPGVGVDPFELSQLLSLAEQVRNQHDDDHQGYGAPRAMWSNLSSTMSWWASVSTNLAFSTGVLLPIPCLFDESC